MSMIVATLCPMEQRPTMTKEEIEKILRDNSDLPLIHILEDYPQDVVDQILAFLMPQIEEELKKEAH